MRALGKHSLPQAFTANGEHYRLLTVLKHDFFAATGVYRDRHGQRAVLKVSRSADFAGVPLAWLGRWLCRRELHFYRKLWSLPDVPRLLATYGRNGFVLEFVQGRPLSDSATVPDGFFDRLFALSRALHERGIAYVDANKTQNILVGDDGLPHLVDFQISWDLERVGNCWLTRWVMRRLQADDFYHLLKHKRRLCPQDLTREERDCLERKSALIRLHRFIFKPYFRLRRCTLQRLRATGRLLPEGSK